VVISGNVFSGLEGPAVEADAKCRRLVVTGNTAVAVNRKTAGKGPALDVGLAKESVVQNNITTPGDEPVAPNQPAAKAKK
jgi:hypothetical protein